MTGPIIIRGDLSGRERDRGYHLSRPVRQRQPYSEHAGRRFVRRDLVAGAFARVWGGSGIGARNHGRSAPMNSFGALKALRSLSRQPAHQPNRIGLILAGPPSRFHLFQFLPAGELHLQSTTGVVGNVRKAFGEFRNVEC